MAPTMVSVLEVTRVCKLCEVEKPISDFDLQNGYYRRICRECYRPILLAQKKGWYRRHREAILSSRKEYYQAYQESAYGYYQVNRERILSRVRECRRDPNFAKRELIANLERYTKMRKMAIESYGGKCECCGEAEYAMLTFDHINGGGRKTGLSGMMLVYDVIREYKEVGYPNDKYRILCWNCNLSIGNYGYCPHNGGSGELGLNYDRQRGRNIKQEMVVAYGGQCLICGEENWEFLTIDHIGNWGKEDRERNGAGRKFYASLKRRRWLVAGLRLLCSNCNCSTKYDQQLGRR